MKEKNQAAVSLARARWDKVSKEDRLKHGRALTKKRLAKKNK